MVVLAAATCYCDYYYYYPTTYMTISLQHTRVSCLDYQNVIEHSKITVNIPGERYHEGDASVQYQNTYSMVRVR